MRRSNTVRSHVQSAASSLLVAFLALLTLGSSSAFAEEGSSASQELRKIHGFASAGLGLPELVHLEAGYFVTNRVSLEAHFGDILFNPMVGIGATGSFGKAVAGRPPRHGFLVNVEGLVNPTLGGLELESGGETLGALGALHVGYGFLADRGFYLRALAGGLFYSDNGAFAAGPNVTVGAGWAF